VYGSAAHFFIFLFLSLFFQNPTIMN
jgi:hypothetical protein